MIDREKIGSDGKLDLCKIPVDQLVELYFQVKGLRADLAKQDKEFKEKQEKLETVLGDRCLEMNVDSYKAGGASITRSITQQPTVAEGEQFLKWAQENNRMDLVQIKHYATPIKEYLDKNKNQLPDGMMFVEKYTVSIRRSK